MAAKGYKVSQAVALGLNAALTTPSVANPFITLSDVGAIQAWFHAPVADLAALKAIPAIDVDDKMSVVVEDFDGFGHSGLYVYDANKAAAVYKDPLDAVCTATGKYFTLIASEAVISGFRTLVADTTALNALDSVAALDAGTECLVLNRGDGYAAKYFYTVGAATGPSFGTIENVCLQSDGTNGYWLIGSLPEHISITQLADERRFGNVSGGIYGDGAAPAWKLSDEGNDANGHGFIISWNGVVTDEIVVTDAVKDAATSIDLTVLYLNLAIAQQAADDTNTRARIVYDRIGSAYTIIWQPDIETSAATFTAPATANDLGVTMKLGLTTAGSVGTLLLGMARATIQTALGQAAQIKNISVPETANDGGTNTVNVTVTFKEYDDTVSTTSVAWRWWLGISANNPTLLAASFPDGGTTITDSTDFLVEDDGAGNTIFAETFGGAVGTATVTMHHAAGAATYYLWSSDQIGRTDVCTVSFT